MEDNKFNAEIAAADALLDPQKKYPPPLAILSVVHNNRVSTVLAAEQIIAVTALQKARKTTLIGMMVARLLKTNKSLDTVRFESDVSSVNVLFFDTEQGKTIGAETMHRVLDWAGLRNTASFRYYDLANYTPDERVVIIDHVLKTHGKGAVIVIDGIVDLCRGFNDENDSQTLINQLLIWKSEYQACIVAVLHQNKGNQEARGHLGAMLVQKCYLEIRLKQHSSDKYASIVEAGNARRIAFDPFILRWPMDADIPYLVCEQEATQVERRTKAASATSKRNELVRKILNASQPLNRAALEVEIRRVDKVSQSTAERYVKKCAAEGIINVGPDGRYRINHLTSNNLQITLS